MRKFTYWFILSCAWILLTPGILISLPGWILWLIAKSISAQNGEEK